MNQAGGDRQSVPGAALLEWINSLPNSAKAPSLSSLNNGQKFWEILRGIDPDYFQGDLPEGPDASSKWIKKWQNLKHISRALTTYVTDVCEDPIPQGWVTEDLKLIAMEGNVGETIKLLKLVLVAAINSPNKVQFIGAMQTLSTVSQAGLRDLIVQMREPVMLATDRGASANGAAVSPIKLAMDQDLLHEEKLGKAIADYENLAIEKRDLQKEYQELYDRQVRLQENNDVLQDKLKKAEDQLRHNDSIHGAKGIAQVKELEATIRQQEDLIANQEGELSEFRKTLEASTKAVDQLKLAQENEQSLHDRIDEMKADKEELVKKVNVADRYKQKLQATQGLEKENQSLRADLEEAREQVKTSEEARLQVSSLQKELDEYKRILPKVEQDLRELQVMKKQLEFNNSTLAQRCELAEQNHERDQQIITDLTDKSRALDSKRISGIGAGDSLDDQLEDSEQQEEQQVADPITEKPPLNSLYRLTFILVKNKQLSKALEEADANATAFEQRLEDAAGRHAEMERKYLEALEGKLSLESSRPNAQGDNARKLRDLLLAEQQKTRDIQSEVVKFKDLLQQSQSEHGKDDPDTMAELNKFNYTELEENRRELSELKQQVEDLSAKLDDKDSNALWQILLSDVSDPDDRTSNERLASLIELIHSTKLNILPEDVPGNIHEYRDKVVEAIVVGRKRVADQKEKTEKQDQVIRELRNRLHEVESKAQEEPKGSQDQDRRSRQKNLEINDSANMLKTASQQELESLKRENRLMATAFHDLSRRLQMSNVTLQRRSEVKGYLNRQRLAVDRATAVGSM